MQLMWSRESLGFRINAHDYLAPRAFGQNSIIGLHSILVLEHRVDGWLKFA